MPEKSYLKDREMTPNGAPTGRDRRGQSVRYHEEVSESGQDGSSATRRLRAEAMGVLGLVSSEITNFSIRGCWRIQN